MQRTQLSCMLLMVFGLLPSLAMANDERLPTVDLGTLQVTANRLYYIDTDGDNDDYKAKIASVGTKIPERIHNIPQSVSVVTQKKLDDLNVASLDELAKRTTGLRVLQNDAGRSSIYARGYEYDQYSIDGLPTPMASIYGNLPNLTAFDRVEVLRGPSGLFNSSSELGGVVNLVRKRGNLYDKNSLTANLSTQGYELSADTLGAMADDTILGRAIVAHQSDKPSAIDKAGLDANTSTTAYLSVDKYFDNEHKNRIGVGYLYQTRNISPNNGLPTYADLSLLSLPNHNFYGAKWNEFENKSHDIFVDGRYELTSKGLLSTNLRYSKKDAVFNYAYGGNTGVNPATQLFSAMGVGAINGEKSLSADINLSQPFLTNGKHSDFVLGADYKHQEQDTIRANAGNLGTNLNIDKLNNLEYTDIVAKSLAKTAGYRLIANNINKLSETALYGKVRYRTALPLTVIVGGRLSQFDIKTTDKATNKTTSYKDNSALTGYGALVYEFNKNLNGYASYTQVFNPQMTTDKNGQLLKPREGDQLEIGIKGQFDDLASRISLYQLDDKNAAGTDTNGNTAPIGNRRVRGLELETNGYVNDNLEISAGYSYLDSTIKQASSGDALFLLMPKHSANLWATYHLNTPLPKPINIGIGANYVGKFSSNAGINAPAATTIDAMISYPINDNFKAQLNVYNLLNKHYYARVGSKATFNIAGNERLIKLSLTYQF